jgi:hypothetical protein
MRSEAQLAAVSDDEQGLIDELTGAGELDDNIPQLVHCHSSK